jgi:hypothetical protein
MTTSGKIEQATARVAAHVTAAAIIARPARAATVSCTTSASAAAATAEQSAAVSSVVLLMAIAIPQRRGLFVGPGAMASCTGVVMSVNPVAAILGGQRCAKHEQRGGSGHEMYRFHFDILLIDKADCWRAARWHSTWRTRASRQLVPS